MVDRKAVVGSLAGHRALSARIAKPEALREVGKLVGADAVVVGQTDGSAWSGNGHRGASLYASVQMVRVADGSVIWSIDGLVTDPQSQDQVVGALADDLASRLFTQLAKAGLDKQLHTTAEAERPTVVSVAGGI